MSLLNQNYDLCECPENLEPYNPQDLILSPHVQTGLGGIEVRPLVVLEGVVQTAPNGVSIPWQIVSAPKMTYSRETGALVLGWGGLNLGWIIDDRVNQNPVICDGAKVDVTDAANIPNPGSPFVWKEDEEGNTFLAAYHPQKGWMRIQTDPLGSPF